VNPFSFRCFLAPLEATCDGGWLTRCCAPRKQQRRVCLATTVPDESLPQLGEREILRGFDDEALAIVETTDVRVVPIVEIDLAFAVAEGEGFTTVAEWRSAHEKFWGREVSDQELVVAQRFRLVERLP
jgi:uncharacterized protein YhfF